MNLNKKILKNIKYGEIEDNDVLPGMPMNFGGNTAQA